MLELSKKQLFAIVAGVCGVIVLFNSICKECHPDVLNDL